MLINYLKLAFRSLLKNKVYGLLNIVGLSIGITCAALIFLWVEDEVNYDSHFAKKDYLHMVMNNQTYAGKTYTFGATPGPMAAGIKNEIPGIRNACRYTWGDRLLFTLADKAIYEQGHYVDSSFFSMFTIKFLHGDPQTAFSNLYSVVISEKMAKKFWGNDNPLGKELKVNNGQNYLISGVVEDLPTNSSIQFDWLAPFKLFEDQNPWLQQWGNNGIQTFVELDPNVDITKINARMNGYIVSKESGAVSRPFIFPMDKWRLHSQFEDGKEAGGRIKYVNLFTTIAWIIVVIACINFMNLATARSERRAREVGVRKVIGARRRMLIAQFIGEALVLSFLSVIVAVGLIYIFLPAFNSLVEKELSFDLFKPVHILALISLALICGLIAGSYPAFYLSSFNPVTVLKGLKINTGVGAGLVRKGLVIAQFSISIILIISTVIIYQQVQYAKDRDLGFTKDGLVYLSLQGNLKKNFAVVRNDLIASGLVKNAAMSTSPILQFGSNGGGFNWAGKDPNKQILITMDWVSPEYVSTMDMKLMDGRDFYPNGALDSTSIIINESLAKLMGQGSQVGKIISRDGGEKYEVVGVIKDFVYNDMYKASQPLVLFCDTTHAGFLNLRLKSGSNVSKAVSKIESVVKANNPGYPVEYKFVDDEFNKFFKSEMLIGKLASVFSVLAIIISCLGLFGLAAFTAERRTKEIGIRKTLGASTPGLAGLLSKDFLQLVFVSCLVAFPLSWWAMHNWLNDFAYRTAIHWWVFALAGMSALLIALLTVSYQAVKAAVANPVDSLRNE